MRLINLISVALLCTGLATALPPLNCDKWRCSPFMGKEVQPGTRLIYSYKASAMTNLPGKKTPVTLDIQTTATIEFYSCRRTLKLSGTSMTSKDGALRGDKKSFQSLAAELEKNVLYFRSNDGAIDVLCSKDAPWVSNFKRGLLSVFQKPRTPLQQRRVHIQMVDIHGSCPAWITRSSTGLRMSRKLDACRGRHRSFGGLQSEAYSSSSPVQNPGLGSYQNCNFKFASARRLVLNKASCKEMLVFKAPLIDSFLPQGSAEVTQELELAQKETFKCPSGCRHTVPLTSYRASGLEMEFEETKRPSEALKAMTDVLCRLAGPVRVENPELFARLTVFLRTAKQSDWNKLVKSKPKALCPKQQAEAVTGVLLEGLAEAGDSRSVRHLTARSGLPDEQKDRLLSAVAFARKPELLLPHLRPVFERFHRLPRASLAAAALVHRFCATRGDRCDQHASVRPLLTPLEKVLKGGCDTMPVSKGVLLFRVLGNMRTPQRIHRSLTDCAERRKAPVELQAAALQALRRSGCPSPRAALLRILSSNKYDSEVRIAAYHALLVCRDAKLAYSLRRAFYRLNASHVTSYIASHISNLRTSTDPDQASLRHFLHDIRYAPRAQGGLSRHFQQSLYSLGNNLGLRASGVLVWSEKSATARSANARLTGQLFGRAVPLVEVRGRLENVHEMMMHSRVPFRQRNVMKKPKAIAQVGLRFFGHDLITNRMEVTKTRFLRGLSIFGIKNKVTPNFRRNCVFADFSTYFSSGAGLPLRLGFVGASSAALETTRTDFGKPRNWRAEYGIKPELALRSEMSASFELPGMRFGGRAAGTAHTRTEWRTKLELIKREFTLSIKAPEKQEALNLRWSVASLHVNQVTPVVPMAPSPAIRWRSKTRLGYRLAVDVQNPPGTPQSRFNNRISVLAERQDTHKNYVLKLWDARVKGKRELGIRMDMEGSRTNRALEGFLKFDSREARLSLKGEDRMFDGAIGCSRTGRRKESCYVTGRNEKGNLVNFRWDMNNQQRPTSVHKIVAKVGKLSLGQLDIRVTKKSSRSVTFWARLKDLLRQPVVLQGSVKSTPPNKFSVGELKKVNLTLTSSLLNCDVTSKVDISPRKYNAIVQVKYALPGTRSESASVKLGWLRLSDVAFRDRFTFKSFSSRWPQLNADLLFKSNIVSTTDFRHYIVLKSWPRYVPLTASVRFLLDRKDRNAQSLIFQSNYDLPKVAAGEAALMCEWNRAHISFVTKLKHACRGMQVVNWTMSVKRKTNNEIDASLTFSSAMSPFGVESVLRRPANGGLSVRFALSPDVKVGLVAKPFYRTVLFEASKAGWMAKGKIENDFPSQSINCSFSENSNYQIDFQAAHLLRDRFVRVSHRMTSRSKQIYDLALAQTFTRRKSSGSLDVSVGPEGSRNQFKASFVLDWLKNLFNSNLELILGIGSFSLRNDYSYELSRRQIKLDGRTHVTSTFGKQKRKLMLQSSMNNLPKQFNSDLQFSSFLNEQPSFVNVKFNVKDKNLWTYAFKLAMDSSYAQASSAELDYSHEIGKGSASVSATARYLKKSLQFSFDGKTKGRKKVTGRLGLDLGATKFYADMSLAARKLTTRLAQTNEGVEVFGADLKFAPAQPTFDLKVNEADGKQHKMFFARERGMWRARLELDRLRGGTMEVSGKARLHAGTGYLGHRFYLSSAVESEMGISLFTMDMKLKPDGELQVAGDCKGVVAVNTPCEVSIDYQKQLVIASMEVGPAALSLQTIPMDEQFLFTWKKRPVVIQAKREGDRVKIQTDIYGYGLRYLCEEKNWAKKMSITRAEIPVLKAEMTQTTAELKDDLELGLAQRLAMNFLCVPPPALRLLRAAASSSSPLGDFAAEGSWDNEAKTGQLKAQLNDNKMSTSWRNGLSPSGKFAVATGQLESEFEASSAAQSFRLQPRSGSARPSVNLRSSFQPGAWSLNFNVSLNKPATRLCQRRYNREMCSTSPGYQMTTAGKAWVTDGGRYGGVKYVMETSMGSKKQRLSETLRMAKGLYEREVDRMNEMNFFKLLKTDYKERTRVHFSDAGQLTSLFHEVVTGVKSAPEEKRTELFAHTLALNTSGGYYEMRGSALKKYLASEPWTNRVVSLVVKLDPSPSLRLRTGLAKRVTGSVLRFDLTGSGLPSNGRLALKTSLAEKPWLDCSLRMACSKRQHFFEFRHTRTPQQGPKVTLTVKMDRNRTRAEQTIALSRGGTQVLSTRYSRVNEDVSLDLTMYGKKHFQGGWKRLSSGYEVLAQSVTMQQPLSLRFLDVSPMRAAVELRTGSDRTPLVLERLRPDPSIREFVLRRGQVNIAAVKVRPFGRRIATEVLLGKDFSVTAFLKKGYFASFDLKVRGPAVLDLSYNRAIKNTTFSVTSGDRLLVSASLRRSGPNFEMTVGEARLTFVGARLEAFYRGQQVARLVCSNPAPRSVSAALFWRPQLLRLAVNEAAETWDSALPRMCAAVRVVGGRMVRQLSADLPEMPPFRDVMTSFKEFGKVVQKPRAFKAVDLLLQIGLKRAARSLWIYSVALSQLGCSSSAKDAILRLRPGIYSLGDRFTTLQTWPDRLAQRFGRLVNGVAQWTLGSWISELQRMKIARPDVSAFLPSARSLRFAQKRLNAGLQDLKAMTMLKGMQHLDKKLLSAMQQAAGNCLEAARQMDLVSKVENAARRVEWQLQVIGPDTWRLQLVRGLRLLLVRLRASPLAADMLRSAGNQLNEAARGVLQVAVPRVEQFNWRHGRARILFHLPPRRLRVRLPALAPSPINVWRAHPAYFQPKVAALYSNFVHTFDQRNFFIRRSCSELPLARYRDATFGWSVTAERRGASFELRVRLGKKTFSFSSRGLRQTGSDRYASVRTWSKGGMQFMRSYNHGFELETRPSRGYVRMRLTSPHYFAKTEGLWGNNDEIPNNDWALPGAPYNSSKQRFLKAVAPKCA